MSPVNGLGFPERWLPVDGHPGYEVSDLGRIRSVDRHLPFKSSSGLTLRFHKGVVRKPSLNRKDGYLMVPLSNGKPVYAHRAVATAFVPGDTSLEVNHRDGIKTNNTPANLEWASGSQNMRHAHATGLKSNDRHRKVAVVDGVVYPSRTDAAKALGVRVSQVSKAIHQGHRLLGLVVTNG